MKVRILVSMSGADFSYMTGEIAEVSPEVGKHWVEIGYAAPVEAPPETAEAAPAPENAMAPRPVRKKTKWEHPMKTRICLVLALVSLLFAAFTAEAADVRLRMLQSISSTEGSFMRGDTVTVSDTIATEWIGAGYAEYADGSWVEAFSSANQAIATNTLVTMTATETVDYLGEYANGAFTPKVDGWYHLQAATNWDVDTATGGLVSLVFYKGASDTYIADQRVATGGQDPFLCPSGILRLTSASPARHVTLLLQPSESKGCSKNALSKNHFPVC